MYAKVLKATFINVSQRKAQIKLLLIAGTTFPSVSAMMAKWAPQSERTRMSTVIYAGKILADSLSLYKYRFFVRICFIISLNCRVTSWYHHCLSTVRFHFRQVRMVMGILHSRSSMSALGLYMDGICVRQSCH